MSSNIEPIEKSIEDTSRDDSGSNAPSVETINKITEEEEENTSIQKVKNKKPRSPAQIEALKRAQEKLKISREEQKLEKEKKKEDMLLKKLEEKKKKELEEKSKSQRQWEQSSLSDSEEEIMSPVKKKKSVIKKKKKKNRIVVEEDSSDSEQEIVISRRRKTKKIIEKTPEIISQPEPEPETIEEEQSIQPPQRKYTKQEILRAYGL